MEKSLCDHTQIDSFLVLIALVVILYIVYICTVLKNKLTIVIYEVICIHTKIYGMYFYRDRRSLDQ